MNVVVLAAGGTKNVDDANEYPHCLMEVDGTPLIQQIVERTKGIPGANHNFVFLSEEAQKFRLNSIASLLVVDSVCVHVPSRTRGSACSALLATAALCGNSELLIVSANELVDTDLAKVVSDFRRRGLDAGTLIFKSIHPRYSFVRLDADRHVVQTAQRDPISNNATAGIFWYSKTADFIAGVKNLIRKSAHVDGSYFVAPVFNELVLQGKKIGIEVLEEHQYIPLK